MLYVPLLFYIFDRLAERSDKKPHVTHVPEDEAAGGGAAGTAPHAKRDGE
jgi:hypothetical protein